MRLFCIYILGSFFAISVQAEDFLRVATFNARNYLSMDRLVEGRFRQDYPKPEAAKNVVRYSIRDVGADILALQEMGSEAHLLELRDDLAAEGLQYAGYAILEAADEKRRVAALWREGLSVEAVSHADLSFKYFEERQPVKRGMLELRIAMADGERFSIFILHLKSKYTDDPRDERSEERRVGEAQAARNRILQLFPDPAAGRFLIVGDLNDGPNSRAVRRFLRRGETAIAKAVECLDEHGLVWTHYYKKGGEYSQIDYILRSGGMAERLISPGGILNRADYYQGSDHRPVWVDMIW